MSKVLIFGIFLLLMNCTTSHQIDIQGHRGCRGLMPENSLPAFEKAIDLGVQTLELDLAISKDRKVVVSHEPYINRLFCLDTLGDEIFPKDSISFNIFKMTYQEIKAFDCGTKEFSRFPNQQKIKTHKPLLSEVFQLVKNKNSKVKFNIEIKADSIYDDIYTPKPEEFVRLVLALIYKYDVFELTNLQSFDLRVLEEVKQQAPKMKVALLVDEFEVIKDKLSRLSYSPEIISPYYKLIDERIVKNLHTKNFQVIPWTINTVEDMQLMINYGVDGIITDYPDILIELLKN
jgi:glycerophosphoryl diester phosphodiesterase